MRALYDVFLSHAWADGDYPQEIADALAKAGLRVWFDAAEINDFTSITHAVTEGLLQSKALLAYYSKTYPLRRACQWELTVAFLAAQAEGDPRRRVLIISPEEKGDHIHPVELRDAKYRSSPKKNGAALQELVQSVVNHVALLDGPLSAIHPLISPNWYGTTPVGSTFFVGRLAEMWKVHSLLHAGDFPQITGAAVANGGIGQVSGLAGVGKSLLAEEYALHFGAAYPGGIFWLRAYGNDDAKATLGMEGREAERTSQLQTIAERLGVGAQGLTTAQIEGALAREIERRNQACLWVVDDVPHGLNGEVLRRWFAPHALARTLITTRSREYSSLARGIDLSVVEPEEAYQLLTSRTEPTGEAEMQHARLLAEELGWHPLALDVTASALRNSVAASPFAEFRAKLAQPDKDALVLAETLADALPNGHEKSIVQTMLRSLRGMGAAGQDFLRIASVLAVAPIPVSLVTAVFEKVDNVSRDNAEELASLAFKQVTSASMAEVAGEYQQARSVHTLVSRAVRFREKGSSARKEALRSAAVAVLTAEVAKAVGDQTQHQQIEFHVAHARQIAAIPMNEAEADLAGSVANYDFKRGAYSSARTLHSRAIECNRRVLGPEHPKTLTSMNNLAVTMRAQGDFAVARELHKETISVQERSLGREHPDTIRSETNLAVVLSAEGDFIGARKVNMEALAIKRRVLELEDRETLTSMSNLADTLRALGDFAGARTLNEEVLALSRRVLGPAHPDTLISMNNLAIVLFSQGDVDGACRLHQETLSIQRRVLGLEHPETLQSMNNLAAGLEAQGDSAGARKLHEETLVLRRRVLGPEHPGTLISIGNLANTLTSQGDLEGARKLEQEMLPIHQRLLGTEHPNTLQSMNNLAVTLRAQGDLAGARKLHEETLTIRHRLFGPEHPHTLESMNNLAATLRAQGDLAGAHKLHEETLTIRRRLLGPEHPHTLESMNNVAETLREQGKLVRARKLHEETLTIRRRLLGPEHPSVLISMGSLAETLRDQGDLVGARELQEELLAASRRLLGPEHPSVLISMDNLASTILAEGDLVRARELQEEALAVSRRLLGPEHPDVLISMNNLAATLGRQGNLLGARKLQEEVVAVSRRLLGPEHPDTSIAAWNLLLTLYELGEPAAALAVLHRDLRWLLDRDPATFGDPQRTIRGQVAEAVKKSGLF